MTVQCCVCKSIREKGDWSEPDHEVTGLVSHTYCPKCLGEHVIKELAIRRRPKAVTPRYI